MASEVDEWHPIIFPQWNMYNSTSANQKSGYSGLEDLRTFDKHQAQLQNQKSQVNMLINSV